MTPKTLFSLGLLLQVACTSSPNPQNDASTSDASGDASGDASSDVAKEAAPVTCTTPGAKCAGGGSCFFVVGDCTAEAGVCSDDTACTGAPTESVCHCDGTQTVVPQCGPGGTALAQAAHYGPCTDAGTD
jgi:hypothetical protein